MGIARVSRFLMVSMAALALFAAFACTDEEPDPAPAEASASVEADADAGHANGDDGANAMQMDGLDLASIMQMVQTFMSMVEREGSEDADVARAGVIGDGQDAGIWVNGVGSVSAAPDLAVLNLGVSATAITVSEARDSAAEAMTAVIAYLVGNGVETADIRTQRISIQPQYDWQDRLVNGIRRSERVLTGYEVSNTVQVLVRELDRTGELLDGATAAAGDLIRVDGINFRIEDTTELEEEARKLAVADAMAKAVELAEYSGANLGPMVYLSEVTAQPFYPERAFAAVAADASVETPINPGEQEVQVTVHAVFDILSS